MSGERIEQRARAAAGRWALWRLGPSGFADLITKVEAEPLRYGRLITRYAVRTASWVKEPDSGRAGTSGQPLALESLDLWSASPEQLAKRSSHLAPCGTCGGDGQVTCPTCSGTLRASCGGGGGTGKQMSRGSERTFTARALDAAGTELYAGQATSVTLADGEKTLVYITLDDLSATSAPQAEAPYLTSLTAHPGEVRAGGTVALRATVRDRNPGDTLTLEWRATGGAFGTPSGGTITWTAPSTGADYSVDCKAVDSQGLSSGFTLPVTVRASSTTSTPTRTCCKHCGSGSKPCGDSCISTSYDCKKPAGCACY